MHAAPSTEGAPREPLAWADFTPATFARAKKERRFIVLDGSAEWCHWCHVMEATTYHDPAVATLLATNFIAVKVDVDSRPDIEERYSAWGWPATVLFSPDTEELGKYRGYIAPPDFVRILADVVAAGNAPYADEPRVRATALPPSSAPLPEEELLWIERSVELALDDYYDDDEGGWGRTQKAPIAQDNAWALDRAREGDGVMRARALFTLEKQRALLDPVWGGIYQYSAGSDWTHPHFEKLMPFEAGALENYAEAYALTGDPKDLATAQSVRRYIDAFLTSKDGAFYATEDADLNAHDATKVAATYGPNGKLVIPGLPDFAGTAAIAQEAKDTFAAYSDFKLAVTRAYVHGSTVALEWVITGTNDGPNMGQKASGRPMGVQGGSVVTFDDQGLIVEDHRYVDLPTIMSQLDPKAKAGAFRPVVTLPAGAMETRESKGTPDEAKTLADGKAFYAALETKGGDLSPFLTDDSTLDDMTSPAQLKGPKARAAYVAAAWKAVPDFAQTANHQPVPR